jgi:EAL domain-containing protein (putative c-di-GMP-specific phosphodiesterase class I)/GGDEF domain-containing protein
MSLIKQLWLAVVFILVLASGGSFILSTLFSKYYLEQQLQMKNVDNVTSLALSMSQMQKDSATIDLLISAQFDSGHYQYIGLFDPNGALITERTNPRSHAEAPAWFIKLVPIEVQAGEAEIQDGWSQFGTLKLESDASFAYNKLWDATLYIALWALLIGVLSCYVGSQILRRILSPLKDVVDQAKAIGDHRFITIEEPKTDEFKAVVNAMNSLSNRIKKTVSEESARLEELRFQTNFDHITGLMNHHYFMSNIDASISHEEYFNQGVLIVSRLTNLAKIDQTLGYQETNAFLKRIGTTLENECSIQTALIAGRLSGTDFAVFSSTSMDAYTLGNQIKNLLEKISNIGHAQLNGNFVTVAIQVTRSDTAIKLATLADSVLDEISVNGSNILHTITQDDIAAHLDVSRNEWQRLLTSALDNKKLKLEHYPVVNQEGELIHHESPVRLQLGSDEKWVCAGEFITWAAQLGLMNRIDELVLETAIDLLAKGAEPIGLNISASAICDTKFVERVTALIKKNQSLADRLYFEVPEQGAFDHFAEFKNFCSQLKKLGCNIGMEHVGSRISRLGELHDVGLDYIKVDVSVIRGIDTNEANKTLLRGLCMIAHSIGVIAIAEGVQTTAEAEALKQLGVDGMTGPGIKLAGH